MRAAPASFNAVVEKDGVNPCVDVPARAMRALEAFADRGRVRDRAYRIGCREHLR